MLFTAPTLTDSDLALLEEIGEYRSRLRWQLHEPKRWTGSLRRLSFARNIQGSNSIEGFVASLDDAAAVVARQDPISVDEGTRRALVGYREAMTYVLQMSDDDDFDYDERLLKSLHFMMTSDSLANRPGLWRTGAIFVRRDIDGSIVYEGPEIGEVPHLIRELCGSLNESSTEPPLVRAALAHLNLVMVHPFRDGNGRAARCLQSLVLARTGVLSPVFMSIEEYLGQHTQEYYDVLATVGGGSWQPARDTRPWVEFMMTAHVRQAQTLLDRVRESEHLWIALSELVADLRLPERSLAALFDAAQGMKVRNGTYRASFEIASEQISEQTAGGDLRRLVEAGLLETRGERRGRHYVAGAPLVELMDRIRGGRSISAPSVN